MTTVKPCFLTLQGSCTYQTATMTAHIRSAEAQARQNSNVEGWPGPVGHSSLPGSWGGWRSEINTTEPVGSGDLAQAVRYIPSQFIKKYSFIYTVLDSGAWVGVVKGQSQWKATKQCNEVSKRLINRFKRNLEWGTGAHNGLGADNAGFFREKAKFTGSKVFMRSGSQPQIRSCQVCPGQGHRTRFLLCFNQGLWESLGLAWLSIAGIWRKKSSS